MLDIDYTRGPSPNVPHEAMPPLYSPEDLEENRRLIRNFVTGLPFVPDEGDPRRTVAQQHEVVRDVPARSAFERLIVPLRIEEPADSWSYLQIRLQIQRYLESHPNALCTVYRMRPHATDFERTLTKDGNIETYQGANPGYWLQGRQGDLRQRPTDHPNLRVRTSLFASRGAQGQRAGNKRSADSHRAPP